MQLDYQQAVVSFCDDLTDPSARSVPIGVLVVGEVKGGLTNIYIAGVACRTSFPTAIDPLTRDMLKAVPRLLKAHVNESLAGTPPATPLESVLLRLYDGLRNSLHVSKIGTVRHMDLGDVGGYEAAEIEAITWAVPRVINEALKSLGITTKLPRVPSPDRGTSLPPAAPELAVWPVPYGKRNSRSDMHA